MKIDYTRPVERREVGTEYIMGVNHPVVHLLYRDGPRRWYICWAVCNGISNGRSIIYRTKRDALAAMYADD